MDYVDLVQREHKYSSFDRECQRNAHYKFRHKGRMYLIQQQYHRQGQHTMILFSEFFHIIVSALCDLSLTVET